MLIALTELTIVSATGSTELGSSATSRKMRASLGTLDDRQTGDLLGVSVRRRLGDEVHVERNNRDASTLVHGLSASRTPSGSDTRAQRAPRSIASGPPMLNASETKRKLVLGSVVLVQAVAVCKRRVRRHGGRSARGTRGDGTRSPGPLLGSSAETTTPRRDKTLAPSRLRTRRPVREPSGLRVRPCARIAWFSFSDCDPCSAARRASRADCPSRADPRRRPLRSR